MLSCFIKPSRIAPGQITHSHTDSTDCGPNTAARGGTVRRGPRTGEPQSYVRRRTSGTQRSRLRVLVAGQSVYAADTRSSCYIFSEIPNLVQIVIFNAMMMVLVARTLVLATCAG